MVVSNQDIVKGSLLQVSVGGIILGFATSHSLSITTNTTEVSTKDHGDFPSIMAQTVSWEVQCENLYTDNNGSALMNIQANKTPVHLIFSKVTNTNPEKGIVDKNTNWTLDDDPILEGDAYLTSFSLNAPSGDNATVSCTFTGNGAFTSGFVS